MSVYRFLEIDCDEHSFGDISIGLPLKSFIEQYTKYEYYYKEEIIKMEACYPSKVIYAYYDSIYFYFDLKTSDLDRIDLTNKYMGKFLGKVGLSYKVLDVLTILDIEFMHDDDFLITDKDLKVSMWCNIDLDSVSKKEALSAKVEGISIRKPRIYIS